MFDDDRFWIVEVDYAKAGPDDLLMRISVTNAGPEQASVHVLPTAWFRNTWAWGDEADAAARPSLAAKSIIADAQPAWDAVAVQHPFVGELELLAGSGPDGSTPELLFCDNETNTALLFGSEPITPFPKDGIGDHVVRGAATVNPARTGTKCSPWYRLTLGGGQSAELRLRLRPARADAAATSAAGGAAPARSIRGTRSARTSTACWRSGRPRPTSSTPS